MIRKLWIGSLLLVSGAVLGQGIVPVRSGPPTTSFAELVGAVHLYGCQVHDHTVGAQAESECLGLRHRILALADDQVHQARRQAFKDAADIVRKTKDKKAAAEALDRRAAD